MQILNTKLFIPPTRTERVLRAQLIERLNDSLNYPLTIISAPAGYGKTTLVSCWLSYLEKQESEGKNGRFPHTAWLSLDADDNDPISYLTYLAAALQNILPDFRNIVQTLSQSPTPPPRNSLFISLINEFAAIEQPTLLILDDYHLIESNIIHEEMAFLLTNLPSSLHIIMLTRTEPPLPIARLRAKNQVMEIKTSDLRFSPDESAIFLNKIMGLTLHPDAVAALDNRTEGWVTGMQLAALSLQGQADPQAFINRFSGDDRYVADYLIEEVLHNQSEETQQFLLKTAVLSRFNATLCNHITGQNNGQAMLEQLEQQKLFLIRLDNTRTWYRYHHLFAELLQQQLQQQSPQQLFDLHQRAAIWFQQAGFISEAIHHAVAANQLDQASQLILAHADDVWTNGQYHTLLNWIKSLPPSVVQDNPALLLYRGWMTFLIGDIDNAQHDLSAAEALFAQNENTPTNGRLFGLWQTLRAQIKTYGGDVETAVSITKAALTQISPTEPIWYVTLSVALGMSYITIGKMREAEITFYNLLEHDDMRNHFIATITTFESIVESQIEQGKLNRAYETCQHVLQLVRAHHIQKIVQLEDSYRHLAQIAFERNELDEATGYVQKMMDLAPQTRFFRRIEVQILNANIQAASRAFNKAHASIENALQLTRLYQKMTPMEEIVRANQARVWLAEGNLAAAQAWGMAQRFSREETLLFHNRDRYLVWVELLLAQNQLTEAIHWANKLIASTHPADHRDFQLKVLAIRAVAHQLAGHHPQAMADVRQAVLWAAPVGYRRIFLAYGAAQSAPMLTLLCELSNEWGRKMTISPYTKQFVKQLIHLLRATTPEKPSFQSSSITRRERDVLQLLANGMTYAAIAHHLTISENTVRSHIKRIYSKLNVHNRTEALEQAKALDLIET